MGKVQQYRRGIGAFIASEKGQRFFNFAYSIGAAIVIWGALFKILHLPGGNALLSIGMGTEVMMFVLTAFDRPPKEYRWEDVFPALRDKDTHRSDDNVNVNQAATLDDYTSYPSHPSYPSQSPHHAPATPAEATDAYLGTMASLADEMQHLRASTQALNNVSDTLLASYRAITENSDNIAGASQGYVEQMQALNRNITGLNTIYEIQLKSISSQLDAIDRVNRGIKDIRDMYERSAAQSASYCEETEKMARYMQQLNQVYERMLTAMSVNMYNPMMQQQQQPQQQQQQPAE